MADIVAGHHINGECKTVHLDLPPLSFSRREAIANDFTDHADLMDCQDAKDSYKTCMRMKKDFYESDCERAPSPGMDMHLCDNIDDLQMWCHMQGYGDTAEAMPESSFPSGNDLDRKLCLTFQGIKHHGWK